MSRKYRTPGYQDDDFEKRTQGQPGRPRKREGPRSPRMMGFQAVMRCAKCGTSLPPAFTDVKPDSRCPNCEADLHTCSNCVFFDTSARFECTQPIAERVPRKNQGNSCSYFEARTRVEKKTTSAAPSSAREPSSAGDARAAFERLFKK